MTKENDSKHKMFWVIVFGGIMYVVIMIGTSGCGKKFYIHNGESYAAGFSIGKKYASIYHKEVEKIKEYEQKHKDFVKGLKDGIKSGLVNPQKEKEPEK